MRDLIFSSLGAAAATLNAFLREEANLAGVERIARLLAQTFKSGGKALIFGNGGSLTDAMHFAEELTGRFRIDRPALPAIAIADPSHLTCVGNDYGFEQVFSRGVEALARPGDVVIGLSTSGNSPNVIRGLEAAKRLGCATVALLGGSGGKLGGLADHQLIAPAATSDRIQELHAVILHILVDCVERELFTGTKP